MSDSLVNRPSGVGPSTVQDPNESALPVTVAVTATLLSLALLTYVLRIWSRCRPYVNLGWDDFSITIAVALTIANWSVNVTQLVDTGGKHTMYIPMPAIQRSALLGFVGLPLWIWSITMIKISVFLMLLRIKDTKRWKIGVWTCIVVVLLIGILSTLSQFLQCRPIEANWSLKLKRVKGLCWSLTTQMNIIYIMTAFFAATDVATALLPVIFIRQIQVPFREKVVLSVLMGMGLIACACGLVKPFLLKRVMYSKDPVWDGTTIKIWTYAEQYLGIIAANIPCLKGLLERAFRALGGHISSDHSKSTSDNGYRYYQTKKHRQSLLDDEVGYHASLRNIEKSGQAYQYSQSREQILMDEYPLRPEKAKGMPKVSVDERSDGSESVYVMKKVNGQWGAHPSDGFRRM